jgi:hypothetical protein
LSGWSSTRTTIGSKNCEKYSLSTLGVARYLRSYCDRWADADCCVLLRAPAQERPRKSEGPTNITTINFSTNKLNRDAQTRDRGGSPVMWAL